MPSDDYSKTAAVLARLESPAMVGAWVHSRDLASRSAELALVVAGAGIDPVRAVLVTLGSAQAVSLGIEQHVEGGQSRYFYRRNSSCQGRIVTTLIEYPTFNDNGMRTTKIETEQTRSALLDAAELLFWKQGTARTTILDIARQAGLTRGAFYHHFSDKAEVFAALIARSRFPQETAVRRSASSDDIDALATLRDTCLSFFELFAFDRARQRMFGILMHRRESLGELEPLAEARRHEIFQSREALEILLKKSRKAGQLSEIWSPAIAALTLDSLMMGLLDHWMRDTDRFDLRKQGVACIDQLFASFQNATPRK